MTWWEKNTDYYRPVFENKSKTSLICDLILTYGYFNSTDNTKHAFFVSLASTYCETNYGHIL